MALRGSTQDFGLADAFQLVTKGHKNGALRCVGPDSTVVIGLESGNVTRVEPEGRPTGAQLGNRLVRAGLLDRSSFGQVLARRARTQEPMADVIVELSLVDPERIREHLSLLATDAVLEVFTWSRGTYEFAEGLPPEPDRWIHPISVDWLLMQAIVLVDEWSNLKHDVPSPRWRVHGRTPLPVTADLDQLSADDLFGGNAGGEIDDGFSSDEQTVHDLAAPGTDVQTILDKSPFHRFFTLRTLAILARRGHLSF